MPTKQLLNEWVDFEVNKNFSDGKKQRKKFPVKKI